MEHEKYYNQLKEALTKKAGPSILFLNKGQPNFNISRNMMIPFDGSTELKENTVGLVILMHSIPTTSGDSLAIILSTAFALNNVVSSENNLIKIINYLNIKLKLPGFALRFEEKIISYRFLIPVGNLPVEESTLVLINEAFNGITNVMKILFEVAIKGTDFDEARKEVDAALKR